MKLEIFHETICRYGRPVDNVRLCFRTFPPDGPDQKVLRRRFGIQPGTDLSYDRDAWGNTFARGEFRKPVSRWTIKTKLLVETYRKNPFQLYSRWNYLPVPDTWPREVRLYLADPADPWESDPAIRQWAESTVSGICGAFRQVHALMDRISKEFRFEVGTTHVKTSPAEVLSQKNGVCQDFTHLLISATRAIGIPARYVSGYLYPGKASEVAVTNHAWAEAYFPEIGWAGFDAVGGVIVADAHVRIAHGVWFKDAAPVSGTFDGRDVSQTLETKICVTTTKKTRRKPRPKR